LVLWLVTATWHFVALMPGPSPGDPLPQGQSNAEPSHPGWSPKPKSHDWMILLDPRHLKEIKGDSYKAEAAGLQSRLSHRHFNRIRALVHTGMQLWMPHLDHEADTCSRYDHKALGAGTFRTVSKARKSEARKEQVLSNALWAFQGPHLHKNPDYR
jgi:hypothetical protein